MGLFLAYLALAFREMRKEKERTPVLPAGENHEGGPQARNLGAHSDGSRLSRSMLRAAIIFVLGTVGIFVGAEPFIKSLEGLSADSGVSVVVLAVIISPIAGEMPEKISMMLLARKGAVGASIAVANVLGSKILNNTLLLAVAVFGAMNHAGFAARIDPTPILVYQMVLVTSVTVIALVPMFRREIGLRVGIGLAAMYAISIILQFILPADHGT